MRYYLYYVIKFLSIICVFNEIKYYLCIINRNNYGKGNKFHEQQGRRRKNDVRIQYRNTMGEHREENSLHRPGLPGEPYEHGFLR